MKCNRKPSAILFALLLIVTSCSLFAAEFSAKIVDRLGRPLPGATVSVYWLKRLSKDTVDSIELLKLNSQANGIVKGNYDEKTVPSGETIWTEVSKDGYEGFSTDGVRSEYVMARMFRLGDVDRIAKLSGDAQTSELRELLSGEVEPEGGKSVEELMFFHEQQFRPALRSLVPDAKVGRGASESLAFIGVPEDLLLVVQHASKSNGESFGNRWAYGVVTSLLEPSSDEEWSFLENCAANDYDDLWVDAGAIETLKLIATPKSAEILKKVLKKNPNRSRSIQSALDYISSNPPTLADRDLNEAGKKVAQAIKMGDWQGNKKPRFNKSGDKALVDCEFIAGRDLLIHTATFHKVGNVWKLRGVRETLQALLANPPKKKPDDKSK